MTKRRLTRKEKGEHDGHVAERLRKLRRREGLTQQTVAEMSGIPYSTYRDWERDHTVPRLGSQLQAVARFYRVKPGYILTGEVEES